MAKDNRTNKFLFTAYALVLVAFSVVCHKYETIYGRAVEDVPWSSAIAVDVDGISSKREVMWYGGQLWVPIDTVCPDCVVRQLVCLRCGECVPERCASVTNNSMDASGVVVTWEIVSYRCRTLGDEPFEIDLEPGQIIHWGRMVPFFLVDSVGK